jgi:hypothetical protein
MMFVKIEVYLMNFYHIYQNYNYPLVKTAFYKIKLAAKAQKASTALASLTILGKIKRALLGLNHIERKKTTASLMMAFSKIKDRNESPALIEQMKAVKSAKIKKMKELLLEKKDEIEYLTSQLEDLNGRTKSRGEIASASKTKDTDLKVFEKKKLQNKVRPAII